MTPTSILTVLGAAAQAASVLALILTVRRDKKQVDRQQAEKEKVDAVERARMQATLDQLLEESRIANKYREKHNEQYENLLGRVIKTEESVASAHKRIDRLRKVKVTKLDTI